MLFHLRAECEVLANFGIIIPWFGDLILDVLVTGQVLECVSTSKTGIDDT